MTYLNPAKVSGGIAGKPILINTQDVAHRNATNSASRTAIKCKLIFWHRFCRPTRLSKNPWFEKCSKKPPTTG